MAILKHTESVSQTASVPCPACGALNEILVPDDSFDEQLKYASLQFACRACGAPLTRDNERGADGEPTASPQALAQRKARDHR